jgi:hypothetical protein
MALGKDEDEPATPVGFQDCAGGSVIHAVAIDWERAHCPQRVPK